MYNRMDEESGPNVPQGNPAIQQQPFQYGQQPIYLAPSGPKKYNVASGAFVGLGIAQIVIGVLSIIVQAVGMALVMWAAAPYTGLYCSVFYILAGAFGIASGRRRTPCPTIAFLVLCILAAVFAVSQLSYNIITALYGGYDYYSIYYTTTLATGVILALVALAEIVIAIVCSSLVCKAMCCEPTNNALVAYTGNGQVPMMVVQNPTGGNMLVQATPPTVAPTKMGMPQNTLTAGAIPYSYPAPQQDQANKAAI